LRLVTLDAVKPASFNAAMPINPQREAEPIAGN